MSGFYAPIILLSLAFSFACGFAIIRFTKRLSKWPRWLVRSVLFALVSPMIDVQDNATPVAPFIYFLTIGFRDLGDVLEVFYIQPLIVGGIGWAIGVIGTAGFSSLQDNRPRQRYVRVAGLACSMPLWFFIACFVFNGGWFDPTDWFDSAWFCVCIICAVCSLLSVMLILVSMSEYRTVPSDVVWTVWAALPVVLMMLFGGFVFVGNFFSNPF